MIGFEEIKEKTKPLADKIPFEKRNKFMKLMKEGKTLGEAKKECELDLETACAILNQNITSISILEKETI